MNKKYFSNIVSRLLETNISITDIYFVIMGDYADKHSILVIDSDSRLTKEIKAELKSKLNAHFRKLERGE